METDPVTGEKKTLELDEKEKLYLDCLDAFYNEGGKQLLSNEEYEQLKLDLDFVGSKVAVYSKDEIRFVIANKRFAMGKPTLKDDEYDALRNKLKDQGSLVVLHEGASCSVDTGLCKTDLRIDTGKTRLLYLPGTVGGLLLIMECARASSNPAAHTLWAGIRPGALRDVPRRALTAAVRGVRSRFAGVSSGLSALILSSRSSSARRRPTFLARGLRRTSSRRSRSSRRPHAPNANTSSPSTSATFSPCSRTVSWRAACRATLWSASAPSPAARLTSRPTARRCSSSPRPRRSPLRPERPLGGSVICRSGRRRDGAAKEMPAPAFGRKSA